ncbi:MAG: ABC transporter permease [Spirosomaceae bacterium]|nr:ABC transporter permease [Spirosomataceae bacterium]
MIRNYLKIAIRNLLKNRVYSFINITGLGLGLSVVILISLFIYDEYNHDRFHKNFDSIYRITETQKQEDGVHPVAVTPGPLADALKKDFAEIKQTLRIGRQGGLIQNKTQKLESSDISVIDPSFFKIFDFKLIKGNPNQLFENPDEIILTEKSVAILFGENWKQQSIIGQIITLQSFQNFPLKVVGIAQNLPVNSHIQSEIFIPFKLIEKHDEWSMKWNSNSFHTYLQLNPKVDKAVFEQKIVDGLKKYANDNDKKLYLQRLSEIYLQSKFDFQTDWGKRSDIFYVYLFITVGLVILLIAVFNFINLATARASQRTKEVGVRKVVGAGQRNLVFQFLFEAMLIVLIATCVAFVLTSQFLPILNQLADKNLTIPTSNLLFWITISTFAVVISLFSGIYPALILSSFSPTKVLKGVFTINSSGNFRKILVVGQFTLSVVLIVFTITIYNQLRFIQQKNLGFDKQNLMYFRMKGDLRQKTLLMKNEVLKLTGVESASATTNNLVNVSNSSNIEWEGQSQNADFLVTQINTDADFLETVGARIVSGRNFSKAIARDTNDKIGTYLLNETAVKQMGWTPKTALGKKVKFWGLEGEVVGVVRDFHFRPLSVQIEPFIFRYRPKEFYFNLLIRTKPQQVEKTIAEISKIYQKFESNSPISYGFVNQDLEKLYFNDQKTAKIILIFSILAIIISCMGLFGLVTYATQLRTKEIGIRLFKIGSYCHRHSHSNRLFFHG